jgi:GNAT superfamily N-acetyltransferase
VYYQQLGEFMMENSWKVPLYRLSEIKSLDDSFSYGLSNKKLAIRIIKTYKDEFRAELDNPFGDNDNFIVIFKQNDLSFVGYVWLYVPGDFLPKTIAQIFIIEEYRKKGIAKRILRKIFEEFEIKAVERPNKITMHILKSLNLDIKVMHGIHPHFIGFLKKDKGSFKLLIPINEYPTFLNKYDEWKIELERIYAIIGNPDIIYEVLNIPGAMQQDEIKQYSDLVLKILIYIDKRNYAPGETTQLIKELKIFWGSYG